ncbi:MAG: hypothetical protein ACYTG4_09180, partial [Planctomycetota bacterium]
MADRTCTGCGAEADHRLKFCRECGGRLDTDEPAGAPGDDVGETVVSPPDSDGGSPVIETLVMNRDADDAPETTMEEPEVPGDDGDQTIMGGAVSDAVKSMEEPDELPDDGDQTIMGGAVSDAVKSMEEPDELPDDGDQTIMGGAVSDAVKSMEEPDELP